MTRRLLLLSNSTNHGRGYLDHAIETVRSFFAHAPRLVFVPFAVIYMRQPMKLDFVWAGLCLLGAVYFIFRS